MDKNNQLRLVSVGVIREGGSSTMTEMVKEKAVSVCSLVTEIDVTVSAMPFRCFPYSL